MQAVVTRLAASSYFWLDLMAWGLFVIAARSFIVAAAALKNHVDAHCPKLWAELQALRRPIWGRVFYFRRSMTLLNNLITSEPDTVRYPSDAEFLSLRKSARLSLTALAALFACAIFLLALADLSTKA